MTAFQPGDRVTVTNPIQPTGHQGGETGTVIGTGDVAGTEVVQVRQDSDGSLIGCYPSELTAR